MQLNVYLKKKQKDKTKVLIHKQVRNLPNFNSSVEKFRDQIKSRIRSINAIKIFNTDQMGVNIELLSKRTLEVCGSKQVVSTVENSMKILYSIDNFEIYLFKFNQYMLRRTFCISQKCAKRVVDQHKTVYSAVITDSLFFVGNTSQVSHYECCKFEGIK